MSSERGTTPIGAIYRLQMTPDFGFDRVAELAPYFADLGVTHLYLSPYLQAAEGSEHGYDVVEHPRLNESLGGREAFERMVDALEQHGLGHIADIVPNHVSTEGNNRWWNVLKHGRNSRHAHWFDIDWDYLDGKVCAPILGDDLEACIERGEITLDTSGIEPVLHYFDHRFPLSPETDLDAPLAEIIDTQNYWLVEWRRGNRNINYRRFFDVNTLAAVRQELPEVFEATHSLLFELIADGAVHGLRVDHIDGLLDPQGYLEALVQRSGVPVWVEKILEPSEVLPDTWPVEGTTGYDFLNIVGGLFVDQRNEHRMTSIYQDFSRETASLDAVTQDKKMLVMRQVLIADLKRLAGELEKIFTEMDWEVDEDLMVALVGETLAGFDVYRTYIRPDGSRTDQDERLLLDAIEAARRRAAYIPSIYFDRLSDVILTGVGGEAGRRFVLRLQQTSGPVMAKSYEDTVFYNFNRLVSLNEVGGDPGYFGVDLDEFHAAASRAQQKWPLSVLATSTHDTKRSEDVRARISLLSEIPDRWETFVSTFDEGSATHLTDGMPDANTRYLFYQVLVGAHPLDVPRASEYMLKAAREAKGGTSWLRPDDDYETALSRFVDGVIGDPSLQVLLNDFVSDLVEPGRINSLAQCLIKHTYPGIPDTYQGTELWDLSLVDPDNRRPVDHDLRIALLSHADETPASELWASADDGAAKMLVTTTALRLRRQRPNSFLEGSYSPIEAEGEAAHHVVAFMRSDDVVVVAPRLVLSLEGEWGDTTIPLPEGKWRNVLTGERVYGGNPSVGMLLATFPVSLLVKEAG